MTSNQIAYWKGIEEKRSNMAQEAENRRHNLASEGLSANSLQETIRHNAATEKESSQHNRAQEEVAAGNLAELVRSNVAREEETARHNQSTESIDRGRLQETVRHDKADEGIRQDTLLETIRSNTTREGETHRHNVATETISAAQNVGSAAAYLLGQLIVGGNSSKPANYQEPDFSGPGVDPIPSGDGVSTMLDVIRRSGTNPMGGISQVIKS